MRFVEDYPGRNPFRVHGYLSVAVAVVQPSLSQFHGRFQFGYFLRDVRVYHDGSLQQVGPDSQEILIPHTQMLGIAPCLQESSRASGPCLSSTRMGICIFAQTSHGAFVQRLAVHVCKELPGRFRLSVFQHPLHGDTVVPQPDRTVVIGIVLVVVVPVFVLRMELRIPLGQ